MDRATLILGNALLIVGLAGVVLLAMNYWSLTQQPAPPVLVALPPSVTPNPRASNPQATTLGALAALPAEQPGSAREIASEFAGDSDAAAPDDAPAGEVALPLAPPADAPQIAVVAEQVVIATHASFAISTPIVAESPVDIAVAWTTVPPRPARPQLAPAPAVAMATGVPESWLFADTESAPDAEPDWREEPSFRSAVGEDNLQVAHTVGHAPHETAASQLRWDEPGDELSRRERERAEMRDGLRWRNMFPDHVEPDP